MKVETYIIDSMPSSSAGGAVILVIMDVETFKINISDFFIFYSCHFSWSRDAYLQSSFIIFLPCSCHESMCSIMWPPVCTGYFFEYGWWIVAVKIKHSSIAWSRQMVSLKTRQYYCVSLQSSYFDNNAFDILLGQISWISRTKHQKIINLLQA